MRRNSIIGVLALAAVAMVPGSAEAQAYMSGPRFDITPWAGYVWGGSVSTNSGTVGTTTYPAGELKIKESFGWGVVLSFLAHQGSAVELTYLRQDTDLEFRERSALGGPPLKTVGFATNIIHIGGRQEFGSRQGKAHPFINGSLGVTVFDPKQEGLGTNTDFSVSIGGGIKYMMGEEQRFGLRADLRGWFTFVPTNSWSTWCDPWFGCYTTQNSATVSQGQVSGGIVYAF
jgi:hypothetical protein